MPARIWPLAWGAMLAALALGGCDGDAPDSAPAGAVSEGEAAALDRAARMLDDQRVPEGALPELETAPAPTQTGEAAPANR